MADADAAYIVEEGIYLVDDTGAYVVIGDVSGLPVPGASVWAPAVLPVSMWAPSNNASGAWAAAPASSGAWTPKSAASGTWAGI